MQLCCHQLSHTEVIQAQKGQKETSKLLLNKAQVEEETHQREFEKSNNNEQFGYETECSGGSLRKALQVKAAVMGKNF